jgi:histidine triad (HIT) family protein
MTTIFSKIINREVAGQFVYEDDYCVAIMDKFPAVEGQLLIIPKEEIDYVFDLSDELYQHLFLVAKKISPALDKAFDTVRTCMVVEGFEVPHVHLKLYPMTKITNLKSVIENTVEKTDAELEETAQKIKACLI